MDKRYVLTLAAIEARLYTEEADSIFMRWPTAEKELPSGNHTPGGLSETCLHFMEDIMTKSGRANHKWDNYLYLHFGGWDLLMDYVRRDPKRRGYLLRCEEKGYSVSEDRHYFDEALVSNGIINGTAAAIPSDTMNCIVEANVYLVRHFCGLYSGATMDTLCEEIRHFLETGSDEERGLSPQMDPQDRYYIFMYIRSCLEKYEKARSDGADQDLMSLHLGTALAWLFLAALLRDSCENLCRLIPAPSIQLLRVRIREAQASPAPAVAPASLPPVPGLFFGRDQEIAEIGRYFDNSKAPFFICGEGACGKTSLACIYASRTDSFTSIYAVYSGDLMNTVASIRFRDTLPMDHAEIDALYSFNLSRMTQYGDGILLIIDNFDAPGYDRTFTELLSQEAHGMTNAEVLEDLMRAGVRILFTTRTTVPPQYVSLCLSDGAHEMPLDTLLAFAKSIYTDCPWTEYYEVLMSQIILAVGKHVMLVELLCAALQQQSGFSSPEEVLDKLKSLRLPQIEGCVMGTYPLTHLGRGAVAGRGALVEGSVYELMRRIFRFSSYEEPIRQMICRLSLLSPLGMDRELFMQMIGVGDKEAGGKGAAGAEVAGQEVAGITVAGKKAGGTTATGRKAAGQEAGGKGAAGTTAAAQGVPGKPLDKKEVRETLLRLRELHLVTIDPRTAHISMHPVLSDVAISDLKPGPESCGVMISNAAAYFDEDSARLYDTRHLEQISAMLKRCAALLQSQPVAVRLSLAISAIDYRLGNYRSAAEWAEKVCQGDVSADTSALRDDVCHGDVSADTVPLCSDGDDISVCQRIRPHDTFHDTLEALSYAARAYAKLGMYDIACDYYEKELELIPEEKKRELAVALNDYGVLLEEMGCFEEAADCLMKAFAIQEELFSPDHPETISTFNNLGLICTDMGDYKAAESFYRRALRISLEYYKEGHPETAVLYGNLGELIMHCCENVEEAAENEAIMDAESIVDSEAPVQSDGPEDPEARLAEARHYLMRALEIATNAYGPSYPDNACTLNNLGLLEDLEGNHKKAREHYRKALEIQRAVAGGDHPHLADILHNLGVSYIDEALEPFSSPESFSSSSVEQKKDALPLLRKALACEKKALAILTAVFDSTHPSVEMLQNEVEWLENELG